MSINTAPMYREEEEATKVFGPGKGESRVTRPQNIKTPSTGGAPATRGVLSRAKLSCDTLRALYTRTVINNTVELCSISFVYNIVRIWRTTVLKWDL